jgi:hypothetical protein
VLCDFGVQNEAQHHAPVFSKPTRARRKGFYDRVGAPIAPRLRPLCALPRPDALSPLPTALPVWSLVSAYTTGRTPLLLRGCDLIAAGAAWPIGVGLLAFLCWLRGARRERRRRLVRIPIREGSVASICGALTTSLQHAPPSASTRSLHPPGRGMLRGVPAFMFGIFPRGLHIAR